MYIQKRIKELEAQRDNLSYEISDIEYQEYSEKIKMHGEVLDYEHQLEKETMHYLNYCMVQDFVLVKYVQ